MRSNKVKNNKQLKKWQKALMGILIPIGVLLLLFIVFCVAIYIKFGYSSNDAANETKEKTTSVYEQVIDVENGADDIVDADTTPIPIKMSDSKLKAFEKYISSINVDYDYEDAYNIDKALEIYNNNTVNTITKHSHDIRVNGEFDADYFYELVKSNNEKFLEEKKKDSMQGFYKEYSEAELKKICTQMCEALEDISKKDSTVDIDTACCYLYNLIILGKSGSLDFGGFDMDNRFYLNYKNMETGAFAMDTDDIEQTTFYHEMMHAFQFACDDIKKADEDRMGITHTYDEIEINPLSWYWLLEGSAEMNMSQYLGVRYSTYKSKITYIDSLNFVSNTAQGKDLLQTEKLCFQRDMNKLFENLGMTSEKEKREIIKMMFSIEILQESDSEFYDWYEDKYGVDLSNSINGEETNLKLTVKEDAILTLTKIFYRNLARQVNSGKVSIQDVYYLMRLWEADIDRHFSNDTVGYMMFFHNFYDTYIDLQNEFLNIIAKENDLNFDDLKNDFESYSMNTSSKSPNCDLKFLSAERKNYIIKDYCDSFYKKGYPSIQSCQNLTKDLCEKYSLDDVEVNKVIAG